LPIPHRTLTCHDVLFFFYYDGTHPDLHSFPTRRSSDLMRLRMFLLLITFLKASHSFRNRLLVICKNAYLFATIRRFLNEWEAFRSEERFSRNAETDLVCRLLLEKKKPDSAHRSMPHTHY